MISLGCHQLVANYIKGSFLKGHVPWGTVTIWPSWACIKDVIIISIKSINHSLQFIQFLSSLLSTVCYARCRFWSNSFHLYFQQYATHAAAFDRSSDEPLCSSFYSIFMCSKNQEPSWLHVYFNALKFLIGKSASPAYLQLRSTPDNKKSLVFMLWLTTWKPKIGNMALVMGS